jgi:hypothetical protein
MLEVLETGVGGVWCQDSVVFMTERSEAEHRGNGRVVARPEIKYVRSVQGPREVYK